MEPRTTARGAVPYRPGRDAGRRAGDVLRHARRRARRPRRPPRRHRARARAARRWRWPSRRGRTSPCTSSTTSGRRRSSPSGSASAGRRPSLLCTSGTAAANFHPAVVEAGLSDVPMIVLTADRPPELRDVGAPQTIDQTHLYGRAVRWFHDPGVARRRRRRRRGARSAPGRSPPPADRAGAPQPAVPRAARRPARAAAAAPRRRRRGRTPSPAAWRRRAVLPLLDHGRGVILRRRGRGGAARGRRAVRRGDRLAGAGRPDVAACARSPAPSPRSTPSCATTGWPPSCGPTSSCASADRRRRRCWPSGSPASGAHARAGRRARRRSTPTTASSPASTPAMLPALGELLAGVGDRGWRDRWLGRRRAGRGGHRRRARRRRRRSASRPSPGRSPATCPPDAELVVASSMPVRDLEWFGGADGPGPRQPGRQRHRRRRVDRARRRARRRGRRSPWSATSPSSTTPAR